MKPKRLFVVYQQKERHYSDGPVGQVRYGTTPREPLAFGRGGCGGG